MHGYSGKKAYLPLIDSLNDESFCVLELGYFGIIGFCWCVFGVLSCPAEEQRKIVAKQHLILGFWTLLAE